MENIGINGASYSVGILPIPGFALMSYACTVEPLRAANLLSGKPLYDVRHFGTDPTSQSSGHATLPTETLDEDRADPDLLLVIAGGDPFKFDDEATLSWIRQLARRGVRIGGISGGAVILAKAGLMKGRRMTVHWEHAPQLSEAFPDIFIERRLYVIDRDRVTCGGGIAPLDLLHALISDQHGSVFARLVSDWFLHTDIRVATAPQRGSLAERLGCHSPHILEAVSAMESHIADPLSLSQLAMVTGVTERQLSRLFAEKLDATVMGYYRSLRLELAHRLVRETAMAFDQIAATAGFTSVGHFSNTYCQKYGRRPSVVRREYAERALTKVE